MALQASSQRVRQPLLPERQRGENREGRRRRLPTWMASRASEGVANATTPQPLLLPSGLVTMSARTTAPAGLRARAGVGRRAGSAGLERVVVDAGHAVRSARQPPGAKPLRTAPARRGLLPAQVLQLLPAHAVRQPVHHNLGAWLHRAGRPAAGLVAMQSGRKQRSSWWSRLVFQQRKSGHPLSPAMWQPVRTQASCQPCCPAGHLTAALAPPPPPPPPYRAGGGPLP